MSPKTSLIRQYQSPHQPSLAEQERSLHLAITFTGSLGNLELHLDGIEGLAVILLIVWGPGMRIRPSVGLFEVLKIHPLCFRGPTASSLVASMKFGQVH